MSLLGKYSIKKHVGAGHFGDVFRAHDLILDAEKAVKIIPLNVDTDAVAKLAEARIMHALRHKHIVKINEADIIEGHGQNLIVIDMEYIGGGSLEDAIRNGSLSVTDAVKYISQVLSALEHAHSKNVLHRDIKPGNILLDGSRAKLSDFGHATLINNGSVSIPTGYTTHLAPEYFTSGNSYQTDIFALGTTLYRAVCGFPDWTALMASQANLMTKIRDGSLISALGYPPHLPNALVRIIKKACHPDPAKRYATATDFQRDLQKLKPGVSWLRAGNDWHGECCRTGDKLTTSIKKNTFRFKKNGRFDNKKKALFADEAGANDHALGVIKTTTFI